MPPHLKPYVASRVTPHGITPHVTPYASHHTSRWMPPRQGGHPGSKPPKKKRAPKVLERAFRQFHIVAGNLGTNGTEFFLLYSKE